MTPHSLTNFETQKHYEIEFRFNGVYSRNNVTSLHEAQIKDGHMQ